MSTSDKQDLARERTDWAEDRTGLANERTFASWMRTGMACVALALGLKAVFGDTDYPIVAKAVAELFILSAIFIFWAATRRCRQTEIRMDSHDADTVSHKTMTVTASILTFGAIAVGIILWLL